MSKAMIGSLERVNRTDDTTEEQKEGKKTPYLQPVSQSWRKKITEHLMPSSFSSLMPLLKKAGGPGCVGVCVYACVLLGGG